MDFPADNLLLCQDPKNAIAGPLRRFGEESAHMHYECAANGGFRCRALRAAVSSAPDPTIDPERNRACPCIPLNSRSRRPSSP